MNNSSAYTYASAQISLPLRVASMFATTVAAFLATTVVAVVALFLLGYRPYVVMSSSMEPALPVGALCVIDTNASYDQVRVGDVVGFRTESGETVTHRVAEVTDAGMVTKGDANDVFDGITTTKQNYVGNVSWIVPGAGTVVVALKTPAGILAVASVMFLMLFANSLIDRSMSEQRRMRDGMQGSLRSSESASFRARPVA